MNDAPEPTGRQASLASRLINGNNSAHLERGCGLALGCILRTVLIRVTKDFELRLNQLQLGAAIVFLDLAVESDDLSRFEAVAQISRVEPNTLQSRPSLAGSHLEDRHASRAEQTGGPDFGNNGGHLTGTELRNAARVEAVFVTKRQIMKQVVY